MTENPVRLGLPDLKATTAGRGLRSARSPGRVRQLRKLHAGLACRRSAGACGHVDPPAFAAGRSVRSTPHCGSRTVEAPVEVTDEFLMLSMSRRTHGHRRRTGDGIRPLMYFSAGHRHRKQLSTLSAANLDGPAPPFAVNLNAQIGGDEFRQLKRPLSRRKFTHPKMTLRMLGAHKSYAIPGHGPRSARLV